MVKDKKRATVRRITIDEQLSEDLIRLEVCELIEPESTGEFKDDPSFWRDISQDGEEILARPLNSEERYEKDSYTELMSIPESQIEQFPWKDLKEGQVYLSGEFEVREEKNGDRMVKHYVISRGKKTFIQIDDDVKENTKNLYYEILAKGENHGRL
jgi:hypothetical protein